MMLEKYDNFFYDNQSEGSLKSAQIIVPLLMDLFHPRTVVDVGCGIGTWLSVFEKSGASVMGLDGGVAAKEMMMIPQECFIAVDLENEMQLAKQFDLALCLEVIEHLSNERFNTFIADLVKLSPVIVFSCAIPGQGGVNHLSEKWQSQCVSQFESHGYVAFDYIRPKIWDNSEIEPHYKQNIIIYCRRALIDNFPSLKNSYDTVIWDVVHPQTFKAKIDSMDYILNKRSVRAVRTLISFFRRNGKNRKAEY